MEIIQTNHPTEPCSSQSGSMVCTWPYGDVCIASEYAYIHGILTPTESETHPITPGQGQE